MSLLKRMVETPLYIDIRKGALDDLATVLADQRVSSKGHIAVVMTEGGKKKFEERLKKQHPMRSFIFLLGIHLTMLNL